MKGTLVRILLVVLVLMAFVTGVVVAQETDGGMSIGRPIWKMKCASEMSVIVEEQPDGTNVVTCFLYW